MFSSYLTFSSIYFIFSSIYFTFYSILTLYLLVSSADNLCKQYRSRWAPAFCQASSGSKLFASVMVILKEFFEKVSFEKKIWRQQKRMQNYPIGKELNNSYLTFIHYLITISSIYLTCFSILNNLHFLQLLNIFLRLLNIFLNIFLHLLNIFLNIFLRLLNIFLNIFLHLLNIFLNIFLHLLNIFLNIFLHLLNNPSIYFRFSSIYLKFSSFYLQCNIFIHLLNIFIHCLSIFLLLLNIFIHLLNIFLLLLSISIH